MIMDDNEDNVVTVGSDIDAVPSDAPKFSLEVAVLDAHGEGLDVNCVRWHPRDGACLASAGDDGAVRLWKFIRK